MIFDIGWSELLVIGVVALVVIGPKDLPLALRTLGRWVGKARFLAREFQTHVDDMIREAELEELRKKTSEIAKDVKTEVENVIDPGGTIRNVLTADVKTEVENVIDPGGAIRNALTAPVIAPAIDQTIIGSVPVPAIEGGLADNKIASSNSLVSASEPPPLANELPSTPILPAAGNADSEDRVAVSSEPAFRIRPNV